MELKTCLLALLAVAALVFVGGCSSPSATPTPEPTPAPPTATPEPTATPPPATATPEPTPTSSPSQQPSRGLFEYTRAAMLLEANLWEDAIPAYGLVIRILPNLELGYHGRGVAYHNEAKEKENNNLFKPALEDLDKAIELKPDFAEAYKDRALLHRDLGDIEKAVSDMEQAVRHYDPLRQPFQLAEARKLLEEIRP